MSITRNMRAVLDYLPPSFLHAPLFCGPRDGGTDLCSKTSSCSSSSLILSRSRGRLRSDWTKTWNPLLQRSIRTPTAASAKHPQFRAHAAYLSRSWPIPEEVEEAGRTRDQAMGKWVDRAADWPMLLSFMKRRRVRDRLLIAVNRGRSSQVTAHGASLVKASVSKRPSTGALFSSR